MKHIGRVVSGLLPLSFAFATAACGPGPVETLLEPDSTFDGRDGARGPFGVHVQRRALDPDEGGNVDADVFVPFTEDADPAAGPFPPAVVIQGGLVPVERYRWLGAHLASRGVVVAAPTHPSDLAFFAADHGTRALGGLRAANDLEDDELFGLVDEVPAVVMGHSLGGVVAAKIWKDTSEDDFLHLALLASFPDEADDFSGREGRVLSISGARDARSTKEEVVAGAAAFPSAQLVFVDEMTHYQWTDDATDGEIDSDAEPTVDDAEVRVKALAFIDALVDDAAGRAVYPFDDPAAWPEGVTGP